MASDRNVYSINENIDAYECASLYENAAVALCTRLHANVFAAMHDVPVIGINYNPKVREFHRWLGTEKYVLELDELKPDNLVRLVNDGMNEPEFFKNKSRKIFEQGIPEVEQYADFAIQAINQADNDLTKI